jgi:uncharacterized protein
VSADQLLVTLLNPGILFFILGLVASLLRSNLTIPEPVLRFVSLYLMLSIGFKGGVSLYASSLAGPGLWAIAFVLFMSALVPVYAFFLLRKRFGSADAAAIGATFGSNSTLTYITAVGFLSAIGAPWGGYMTVALVVMETPAVILGILLARGGGKMGSRRGRVRLYVVLRRAITDGTLVVLVGSLIIGYLLVALGEDASPLNAFIAGDMFTGMLIFFLLYMGTMVGRELRSMTRFPWPLTAFAFGAPIVNAALAFGFSRLVGLAPGDGYLLMILCASASYIVAPVILREGLPEANPGRYLTMSIGLAFPFNIVLGIPVYWWIASTWL